jgi:hypothetical protein
MARYPKAIWRDVGAPGNFSNGVMQAHLGVVLHVNDAQSRDLYGWITGDNGMSCHFQVAKDGTVWQYIDTQYSSWCQKDGNDTYLSIESQGLASELATPAQIAAIGGILAWAKATHDIPLQLAEVPGQRGFGWHGMGAAHGFDWGHSACPGVRRDQRSAMLAAAHGTPPNGGDDDMPYTDWPKADQDALAKDVATAVITRGVSPYNGTLAEILNDTRGRVVAAATQTATVAQRVGALTPAGFAAALTPLLVAALPNLNIPQAELEAALRTVLGSVDNTP